MNKKPICFSMFPENYPLQMVENDCENCPVMDNCIDKTRLIRIEKELEELRTLISDVY